MRDTSGKLDSAARHERRRGVISSPHRRLALHALRLRPAPRLRGRDRRSVAVLSSAPLQSRLLQQPGQKKYKGRHSFVDFLPSTVE